MTEIPNQPKIFHITHLRNLHGIVREGVIWSDAKRNQLNLQCNIVGMTGIKRRRMQESTVHCHPGTFVGEFVPFNFCPRSIMLYILHKGNLPDLAYQEGQSPIVHLQADLFQVIQWANYNHRKWAFTDANASARYSRFFNTINDLNQLNWNAIHSHSWSEMTIKEGKQAEFLLYGSFSWELIELVGAQNMQVVAEAQKIIANSKHRPKIVLESSWYY